MVNNYCYFCLCMYKKGIKGYFLWLIVGGWFLILCLCCLFILWDVEVFVDFVNFIIVVFDDFSIDVSLIYICCILVCFWMCRILFYFVKCILISFYIWVVDEFSIINDCFWYCVLISLFSIFNIFM